MSLVNVNSIFSSIPQHVKFISYDGKYPNLCSGDLVLEIDGEEHKFSNSFYGKESDTEHFCFWRSGGNCGFSNGYEDSYINHGDWIIDVNLLPKKFQSYAMEIDLVFNKNVEQGCCGGCL